MKIEILNPIYDGRWLTFISKQENATIFHHPSWMDVLNLQYGFKVFAICALNEQGEIQSGIPFCEVHGITRNRKWISLPFSDTCRPLSVENNALKEILDYCINANNTKVVDNIEIRYSVGENTNFREYADSVLHTKIVNYEPDKLFHSFKKTQIQQPIIKSQKEGLNTIVSTEQGGVDEFYKLHLYTRKRLGVPIQPKRFFKILSDKIIIQGMGFTVLVYKENICISAGIFLGFGKTLTYKYSASDKKYLNYCPNHLMLWTAMSEAIKRGYTLFDFGKSENDHHGLRKFKSGWGAIEEPLRYSYYPEHKSGGLFTIINKNIVIPIIRNSPAFVCRLSGECLYKYFG